MQIINTTRTTLALLAVLCVSLQGCASTLSENKEYHSDKPVVLFILDSSGSMAAQESGERKIDIAKQSIIDTISQVHAETFNTALITFDRYRDCKVDVAVGPDNSDPDNVVGRIRAIDAAGATPLAAAILRSGEVLKNVDKKMVILFSDGKESCQGDPVQAARELYEKYGININVQVIGYGVDPATQSQLEQIATAGEHWGYHPVNDSSDLSEALNTIGKNLELFDPIWQDIKNASFQFDSGSDQLVDRDLDNIQKVYRFLKNNRTRILIIGHTDSVGSRQMNYLLSINRANAVKDKLVELGIAAERIQTAGRGELEPAYTNETPQGRMKNRRVNIEVFQK